MGALATSWSSSWPRPQTTTTSSTRRRRLARLCGGGQDRYRPGSPPFTDLGLGCDLDRIFVLRVPQPPPGTRRGCAVSGGGRRIFPWARYGGDLSCPLSARPLRWPGPGRCSGPPGAALLEILPRPSSTTSKCFGTCVRAGRAAVSACLPGPCPDFRGRRAFRWLPAPVAHPGGAPGPGARGSTARGSKQRKPFLKPVLDPVRGLGREPREFFWGGLSLAVIPPGRRLPTRTPAAAGLRRGSKFVFQC